MALLQATAVRATFLAQQATAASRHSAAALPAGDAPAAASRSQQPSLSRIFSPCFSGGRALCLDARRTRSSPPSCTAFSQLGGISPGRPLGALPPQSFLPDGGQEGTRISCHDLPQVPPSCRLHTCACSATTPRTMLVSRAGSHKRVPTCSSDFVRRRSHSIATAPTNCGCALSWGVLRAGAQSAKYLRRTAVFTQAGAVAT